MVFFNLVLFSVISVATLGKAWESQSRSRDYPTTHLKAFQSRSIENNRKGCAEFRYWRNGELQWCGHKLNILTATVSNGTRKVSSILSELSNRQLSASTTRNMSSSLETRVASDITFAFETGTRRLVTAWGPNVQLKKMSQHERFDMFENIQRGNFSSEDKCSPFCNILKRSQSDVGIEYRKRKGERRNANLSKSAKNLNTSVSRREMLYDCKDCYLGISQRLSCFDLLYGCLGRDGVCSASPEAPPKNLTDQSLFCRGIYILYIDKEEASCPMHIEEETLLSYSAFQLLKENLAKVYGNDVQVTIEGTELDESIRKLGISSKQNGGSIRVEIRVKEKQKAVVKTAIEKAMKKGEINDANTRGIHWGKTIDTLKCSLDDSTTEYKCTVDLIFKGIDR